jgi:hypothetical protein
MKTFPWCCVMWVLAGCLSPRAETSGTWVVAGTPTTSAHRYNQSATVLSDGRVLAAGGETWDFSTPSWGGTVKVGAETFDPASRLWTPTGSLNVARGGHRATLLSDGRVLVTGGESVPFSEWTALASAELYDPVAGTWRATAPMASARVNHAQVLLADGRVMVAGGTSATVGAVPTGPLWLATVEVFDPSTETWTTWAPLSQAEPTADALRMGDGRPLITGLFHAEVYDPLVGSQPAPAAVDPYRSPPPYAPQEGLPCGDPGVELATALADGSAHLLALQTSFVVDPTRPLNCRSLLGPPAALKGSVVSVGLPDGGVFFSYGQLDATVLDTTTGDMTALPPRLFARGAPHVLLLHDGSVFVTGGADAPSELFEWN